MQTSGSEPGVHGQPQGSTGRFLGTMTFVVKDETKTAKFQNTRRGGESTLQKTMIQAQIWNPG